MELTSNQIYNLTIHGAYSVIRNKEILNRINVFPVRDGDTGNNLASMMNSIIQDSKLKKSVKQTLESIAEAALYGARGNSGVIFAQYFNGLSESVNDDATISVTEYAKACSNAVTYAYEAIEKPVEGTIITVMRAWGLALSEECRHKKSLNEIFTDAFSKIELVLENTKEQLDILKKSNVVDSGAKGFTYFIEGALYYIMNGGELKIDEELKIEEFINIENKLLQDGVHDLKSMDEKYRYCTECLIEDIHIDIKDIKNKLTQMGESVVVATNKNKCRIHIHTNEPADIFDYLYENGTIIYQKIDDMLKQKDIINNCKSKIALVTDSIADLPQNMIDKYQIHVVNLDVLFQERTYMDKLTIKPDRLLEISKNSKILPTSSQPTPKKIENLFDYLASYYESAIVLTVSKELSGTYNNFKKVSEKYKRKDFKISVINTKQNSAAQGLLVKSCAELIEGGLSQMTIIKEIEKQISRSKILVQVRNLDNMIKSGRLSVKAGHVGKRIGMKPIVTLDNSGKGALDAISFSIKGSNKKILSHIRKLLREHKIKQYAIVHVNNEVGAEELKSAVRGLIEFMPEYVEETSSIVAVGAGQGAVAFAYVLEEGVY